MCDAGSLNAKYVKYSVATTGCSVYLAHDEQWSGCLPPLWLHAQHFESQLHFTCPSRNRALSPAEPMLHPPRRGGCTERRTPAATKNINTSPCPQSAEPPHNRPCFFPLAFFLVYYTTRQAKKAQEAELAALFDEALLTGVKKVRDSSSAAGPRNGKERGG